jgi:hypothetical protein
MLRHNHCSNLDFVSGQYCSSSRKFGWYDLVGGSDHGPPTPTQLAPPATPSQTGLSLWGKMAFPNGTTRNAARWCAVRVAGSRENKSLLCEHYRSGCQRDPLLKCDAKHENAVMERNVHQENLAHLRRLLAESKIGTSKDEIRHSMLMRLLAEEESKELLAMPVMVSVR